MMGLVGIEEEGVAPAEMFDLNGQVLGVADLNIEFVVFLLVEIGMIWSLSGARADWMYFWFSYRK